MPNWGKKESVTTPKESPPQGLNGLTLGTAGVCGRQPARRGEGVAPPGISCPTLPAVYKTESCCQLTGALQTHTR